MGVQLGQLLKRFGIGKFIDVKFLSGKTIVVDALPTLYEMLAMIRDKRGLYLVDSRGRVTSHLVGLFNRICRMLANNIKPIFVFDGPPHPLKMRELESRRREKEKFQREYIKAILEKRYEDAKKLGKRAMFVNDEMIKSARRLIELFGLPIIDAPHDAEAEGAYIVSKGLAYAISSRDWDAIIFGADRLIMDLKLSPNTPYVPRLYELDEVLKGLNLEFKQLVDLAILIGTDFNPGGFKGIGVVKAYELIRRYGSLDKIIELGIIRWNYDFGVDEVREIFLNPPVREVEIKFGEPKFDKIVSFLVDEYNFNRERVLKELRDVRLRFSKMAKLDSYFK